MTEEKKLMILGGSRYALPVIKWHMSLMLM